MMVDVLASDQRSDRAGLLTIDADHLVHKLGSFLVETSLHISAIFVMVESAVLNAGEVEGVLLADCLFVIDGLQRDVIVVLVDLSVDGGCDILVLDASDGLVGNGLRGDIINNWTSSALGRARTYRSDTLMDRGVVVAGLGQEFFDGLSCSFHCAGRLF